MEYECIKCQKRIKNQKILKYQDDFWTQSMTLHSPINMRHNNCALLTDPFHEIDILSCW